MTIESPTGSSEPEMRIERDGAVPSSMAGMRVDQVAATLWPEFSRAMHGRWLRSGELLLDDSAVPNKTRVYGGETLSLRTQGMVSEAWNKPQAIEFAVVYEDEDMLVVNKPVGLVTHPGAGNLDGTLVNGLLAHRPELGHLPRAGIIHRLDKDTSGLLLVAATEAAHTELARAMQERAIHRSYLAVAEGLVAADQTIDQAIGRDPNNRLRQKVSATGKRAVTHVEIYERWRCHSLVRAELETGRTHQIRVHMAHAGYPLVGDSRYGAKGRLHPGMSPELVATLQGFTRQALHAQVLTLTHPGSGAELTLEAQVPADFASLVAQLQQDAERAAIEQARSNR